MLFNYWVLVVWYISRLTGGCYPSQQSLQLFLLTQRIAALFSPGSFPSEHVWEHFSKCNQILFLLFPGGISRGHDLHAVRPVHRSVPSRDQCADVLWDDRELGVHHGQARRHMGGRSAAGATRAANSSAGHWGRRSSRRDTVRALRGANLHRAPRHTVRPGSHLRWCTTLVVLWLLLLSADAVHHLQLAPHRSQDPPRRAGLHPRQQEADPARKPDELHRGGAGHPLRLLHHPGEHLQHHQRVHGG